MKSPSAFLLAFFLGISAAHAAGWVVDEKTSHINFSGTNAGQAFTGEFKTWNIKTNFDPAKPGGAKITAMVEMASATTGTKIYDEALPQTEWFDAEQYPQATFVAEKTIARADGITIQGTLTLKGKALPINLACQNQQAEKSAQLTCKTTLDRIAFGIGATVDAKAAWVSKDIVVTAIVNFRR